MHTIQHLVLNGSTRRRNVTTIKRNRFYKSPILETVQIDDDSGINCIAIRAFEGCTSLRSVHLSADVTKIHSSAFMGCTSLQSICIPETVTAIKNHVFCGCTSLTSIQIPENVTNIGYGAFCGCSSLTSIRLPENVTAIGDAFQGCSSLRSINLPDGITIIGLFAFRGCASLKSIFIPNSVKIIEFSAFQGCESLLSIHIPNGADLVIEEYAFSSCFSLRSIYIPNTVTSIESNAFDFCHILEQRQANGLNYHPITITWLRRRFDNLPIHEACYHADDTDSAVVDNLSTLIQDNQQTLTAADAMGMTALHILCCNPRATADMVRVLVENDPSLLTQTDVTGSTPLQLFLECRRLLLGEDNDDSAEDEVEESTDINIIPTLRDLLGRGIKYDDLAILFVLVKMNREIDFTNRDESTGLMPYMSAATSSECGLDVVFALAMENLEKIV